MHVKFCDFNTKKGNGMRVIFMLSFVAVVDINVDDSNFITAGICRHIPSCFTIKL